MNTTIHITEWVPALSKELRGYPTLAVKMTAMKLAPTLGIKFAPEMQAADVEVLKAATRDQIKGMLASAKSRAK